MQFAVILLLIYIMQDLLHNNLCNSRDTFALCILNSVTSIVAGFAVFSVLGFMSYELGIDISMVAESGMGWSVGKYCVASLYPYYKQ